MARGPRASPQARGRRPLLRVLARSPRGCPRPDQEIPVRGCPCPPAQQRDLGVDEASKVREQQAKLSAAATFSVEGDGPGLIAAVAPLGRSLPATRAPPSGPSPAY